MFQNECGPTACCPSENSFRKQILSSGYAPNCVANRALVLQCISRRRKKASRGLVIDACAFRFVYIHGATTNAASLALLAEREPLHTVEIEKKLVRKYVSERLLRQTSHPITAAIIIIHDVLVISLTDSPDDARQAGRTGGNRSLTF